MSFDDYAKHISKKLKLAVSLAVIRSVPENLTTDEYIDQLKSNILDQKDSNSEISVCSDDFELYSSNLENNSINNINNNNNFENNEINNTNLSDNEINNTNLSNNEINNTNLSDNEINNTNLSDNKINNTNLINNVNEILINNSKGDSVNNDFDKNCIRDDKLDNLTVINNTKAVKITRNEENNTVLKINDRENDFNEINENENDTLITNSNISLENDDYNNFIDEVLQLGDSQMILNDFCVNDIEDTDNMDNNRDVHMNNSEEMSAQDIFNATQTIDFTKTLDLNDETYYESAKGTSTECTTKIYQKLPNSDIKGNKDDRFVIIKDTKTTNSNSKQDIHIDNEPSPKRRKNFDPKLQTDRQIEDANSRIRNNISKFLDKNSIALKAKVITENDQVRDSLDKKLDKNFSECTQTNTYYSQSQPLLVIDQKFIYETSKSIPRIEKDLNLVTEITNKDLGKSTNDTKNTRNNIKETHHDTTDKESITQDSALETASEDTNYKSNSMKITENETEFNFEREVYHFSQTSVFGNEDIINKSRDRNDSNNKMKPAIIENNCNNTKKNINTADYNAKEKDSNADSTQNNNNSSEIQYIIDLTHDLSPISEQDNNNRNINRYNNSSLNKNASTQSSINSMGLQFSPINQNNDNTYKDNSHIHINDNNKTTKSNINDNNETKDLTQNHSNDIPIQNPIQNEEVLNESRNSNTDLTDSDEAQTEEVIPFKIVEELNKVKNYLYRIERGTDSSSDTGYKSDSQSRYSMKLSQSNVWLNQSAHSLFSYITSCQVISNTLEMTNEISAVLAQLIQKLYDEETYLSFMEEMLDTVDMLLHSVLDENSKENEFVKKEDTMERILLLNKCIHLQKFTIEKITHILENIHKSLTKKDTLYETEDIQKIENSCYIFHILHIILQRYYKNKENLTKKPDGSQKSQFDSQKSQLDSQKSQLNSQKSQLDSQKSQFDSQKSQFSSKNSQEVLKKTDISDIWRKKWNPNYKAEKNEENVDEKCALTDCSKVLNKLIVSCMDGYSLVAYFALKCFNLMQS